jgi:hypothetical protein
MASNRRVLARAAKIAVGAVMAAAIWTPASAQAGVSFDLTIGSNCLRGTASAPAGSQIHLALDSADGLRHGLQHAKVALDGTWRACLNLSINAGDNLTARTESGAHRIWRVPLVSATVDRSTNVVSGRAPAGAPVHLEIEPVGNAFATQGHAVADVVTGTYRHFRHDFTGELDIGGGMYVTAAASLGRDTVRADAFTLWVWMQRAQPVVHGYAGGPIELVLQDPGGVIRATAHVDLAGPFYVILADLDGNPVYPRPGDVINVPQVRDGALVVPHGEENGDPSTNTIFGRCMPKVVWELGVHTGVGGMTDGTGHFSADFTGHGLVRDNQFLDIFCHYATGDLYQMNGRVH